MRKEERQRRRWIAAESLDRRGVETGPIDMGDANRDLGSFLKCLPDSLDFPKFPIHYFFSREENTGKKHKSLSNNTNVLWKEKY